MVDSVDQAGHDTHNTYDLAGRLVSVTQAYGTSDAATTTYTYDAAGRKLSQTDPLGHTNSYTYDAAGNLTSVSGPGGTFQYSYDNARNRVSMTDGNGNTTSYAYDARKRLVTTTYPDKTTTTDAYDGPGNLIGVTDQAGNQVQYTYDAANQLKSVIQVNSPNTGNNTTAYGYDPDGNLTALTDANSHTTSNSYDLLYELRTKTLPDGASTETRNYDPAGNLLSLTHFSGYTTSYAYDQLNRLQTRTPDSRLGESTVSFTYTQTGKRASMTDASGLTSYSYDSLDRLITKVTPEGTLNYTYDAAGNLASMASADGNVSVSYNWNTLNQLSSVVDSRLGTTSYAYDTASNLVTATYPNGIQSTLNYDTLNRLTSLTTPTTGYLYQLGPTGNRTNVTEATGRSINWNYDGIYRLTNEAIANAPSKANGSVGYGLDPVGNRLSATSTIGGINSGSLSFNPDDQELIESYDADGNTTATGGRNFAYDSEDRLKSMNGGAVTIVYDGDGNRVAKTVNGATTRYLVDDLNPSGYAQVVEETGATQRTYTYGLQRISEYQVINTAATPSFYGYDGMGSVRQLTNSAGATTDTYEYDAFGNEINSTGTTPNEFLYRGEQYDSDLALYYLRARYYNPLTGRFLGRDPAAGFTTDPKSLHKYLYADGDPINTKDPSGRDDLVDVGQIDLQESEGATAGEEAEAKEVSCIYKTAADALSFVVPGAGEVLESLVPEWKSCKAEAKTCSEPRIGFRAVSEAELYDIANSGVFRILAGGVEGKYFSYTEPQAWDFGNRSYGEGNFGVVKGEFPCSVPVEEINPLSEGPGFVVREPGLSQGIPTILWP